jgi:signal transduction histidine kinase
MVATNAVLGGGAVTSLAHRGDIGQLLSLAYGIGLVTLPFVYLSGVLRAHRRITDLMLALEHAVSPSQLRDLLAEALGDPKLVVGFWTGSNEYTGVDGTPVTLPPRPEPHTLTRVSDGDHHLAVLVHDPAVATRPALVRTVVAAARLALSNARLQALQRRQLDELRASRERLAVAALDERRRIERDLHDGVQQRLLRLSWLGQQALDLSAAGPAGPLLRDLVGELRDTGAELRELARGIHPALITDRGLAAAVEEYAVRGPLAVEVDLPARRYPGVVEVTAFFVILEAVVNAAKHAGVDRVEVRGQDGPGRLVVEVCDSGTGGADPRRGTGLRNMADRLAAVRGSLTVTSPPGGGTRVTAVLPCA